MGNLSRREHEQPKTMDCAVEGFPDEACPLPLHQPGGGAGVCAGGGRTGTFPDADADVREVYGLPGFVLLFDVQSLPRSAGGATDAGGGDFGRGVVHALGRVLQ